MTIRCITFDLDDTLWETGPVIARAEEQAHAWLARHAPAALAGRSMAAMLEHRRAFYATLPDLQHDFTALRRRWLARLMRDAGLDEGLAEPAFDAFWQARNAVLPFPDAMAVVARLSEQFVLGTITNGNACVHRVGIGHHFAFAVTAGDAGAMKPAAAIFTYALARVGVAPEETVHVGDDPVNDVHGAAALGMRTVWINPDRVAWDSAHGGPPDAEIRAVADLEAVLLDWLDQ